MGAIRNGIEPLPILERAIRNVEMRASRDLKDGLNTLPKTEKRIAEVEKRISEIGKIKDATEKQRAEGVKLLFD